jgi:hypothetical protein
LPLDLAIGFDVSTNPLERGKFEKYVLEYKPIVCQFADSTAIEIAAGDA